MADAPVFGPDGQPLDRIQLKAIRATAIHGAYEHERAEPQLFVADVNLYLDTRAAAATDDLAATVDYSAVANAISYVLTSEPVNLIETLAEQVAAAVLAFTGVVSTDVVLHKPGAVLPTPCDDVTVTIRRDSTHRPPSVPAPGLGGLAGSGAGADALPHVLAQPLLPLGVFSPTTTTAPPPVGPVDTSEELAPVEPDLFGDAADVAAPPVLDGSSTALDAEPLEPVTAILGLGSNLGDSKEIMRGAVAALQNTPGVEVLAVAPLARTSPVGGPAEQNDYLNTVVQVSTTLSPRALLAAGHQLEDQYNRIRAELWGPRTLDVDVITYGSLVASDDDLTIPHKFAGERAFVLLPWSQLDPDAVLPGLGGGPVATLAATAPDRPGIRWMALDWLAESALADHAGPAPMSGDAAGNASQGHAGPGGGLGGALFGAGHASPPHDGDFGGLPQFAGGDAGIAEAAPYFAPSFGGVAEGAAGGGGAARAARMGVAPPSEALPLPDWTPPPPGSSAIPIPTFTGIITGVPGAVRPDQAHAASIPTFTGALRADSPLAARMDRIPNGEAAAPHFDATLAELAPPAPELPTPEPAGAEQPSWDEILRG